MTSHFLRWVQWCRCSQLDRRFGRTCCFYLPGWTRLPSTAVSHRWSWFRLRSDFWSAVKSFFFFLTDCSWRSAGGQWARSTRETHSGCDGAADPPEQNDEVKLISAPLSPVCFKSSSNNSDKLNISSGAWRRPLDIQCRFLMKLNELFWTSSRGWKSCLITSDQKVCWSTNQRHIYSYFTHSGKNQASKDGELLSVCLKQKKLSCFSPIRKPQESTDVSPEGGAMSWQRVTLILELLQHKKKLKRAQMLVPVLFSLLAR